MTAPGIEIPQGFTRERLIKCAERELAMRERVYPKWVAAKRMKLTDAEEEIAAQRAIVAVLRQLPVPQPGLPGVRS